MNSRYTSIHLARFGIDDNDSGDTDETLPMKNFRRVGTDEPYLLPE